MNRSNIRNGGLPLEVGGKKGITPKKANRELITWDTSHYEVFRWDTGVKELINVIQNTTNLKVEWLKGRWTDQLLSEKKILKKTKILVLTGIGSKEKISKKEIEAIKNFVKDGGRLFLSAPLFKSEDTNTLVKVFGAEFLWNKIKDEEHHEGNYSDHVIISNFNSHQISEGVKEFCFGDYGGFPLKINQKVFPIAQTANSAQPPNAIVLATTQYGKGSIVFLSSSNVLRNKYLGMYDNKKLAENIFSFLSAPPITTE